MTNALLEKVIERARADVGLREIPPGSNRSPRFDQAIRATGLDPELPQKTGRPRGYAYCVAMPYLWFQEAAAELGVDNPMPRTARVASLWKRAPRSCRRSAPERGALGLHLVDSTKLDGDGHLFLVENVLTGPGIDLPILSIEANTGALGDRDPRADRDGDGVRFKARGLAYANLGYLVFG